MSDKSDKQVSPEDLQSPAHPEGAERERPTSAAAKTPKHLRRKEDHTYRRLID